MVFPGLILAGGASRRMGTDKALACLGTKTLLEHAIERLSPQVSEVWINRPKDGTDRASLAGHVIIPDTLQGRQGPLAGILAGLSFIKLHHTRTTHLLSVPVDTPFFPTDLAYRLSSQLEGARDIVLAQSLGREHPVVGLWPVSLGDDLEAWLTGPDNRRVLDYLARHRHRYVAFEAESSGQDPFFNINSPGDLKRAEDRVKNQQP